jgi:hypothetical protein
MDAIDKEALEAMNARHRPGTHWAAYENQAFDSSNAGHLQFLLVGNGCTYAEPPAKYPMDNANGMGWRYVLVGTVNLSDGSIGAVEKTNAAPAR